MIGSCVAEGRSIRIRGGGTKSHGLPEADMLLSTGGLRGIRAYARDDLYVTVGTGTPLGELQGELARDRMWVPLVAPWLESTVGGIVATNWNAPLRMRYGGVRDLVLAVTVALPDRRVIRAGRPVVKNVAGYDLPKVFLGAYGTLGLIADVTLKLAPLPRARASLIAPVEDIGRGLEWGVQLLQLCLNASALLLIRSTTNDQPPATGAFDWSSVVSRRSSALIYTAEGSPEDVRAELAEVHSALQIHGASEIIEVETPSGSDIWAGWLAAAPSDVSGSQNAITLRVGTAPRDLPDVLRMIMMAGDAQNGDAVPDWSFVADLANGLIYLRGVGDVAAVRRSAHAVEGYAIVLPLANAPQIAFDVWGHIPDSLDLMHALRKRWGAGGLLNPGVFLV